jgi:hypothetical protein
VRVLLLQAHRPYGSFRALDKGLISHSFNFFFCSLGPEDMTPVDKPEKTTGRFDDYFGA